MRSPALRAMAVLLCLLLAVPAANADEKEAFGITILKAAGTSAAGKGAEFLVKLVGSAIYDGACKGKTLGTGDQYLCDALAGITGKGDEEWKKKVEKQLGEINDKLGALERGQKQIQYELTQQSAAIADGFNQAAAKHEATRAIVRIENLWEKYVAQFDKIDSDLERDSMVAFAKDIINNNLHTKLGDLNVVLTKDTNDSRALLRHPFYEWRMKKGTSAPPETFNATDVYEFAERKFMDFRYQQHKVYVMYLWAATVLESDCSLHKTDCVRLPRSTADFRADYDRYTRQQVETFNSGLDWVLLSYALNRVDNPKTLPFGGSPEATLLRANFLSAAMLTDGAGWWGRVIAMGNKWDGALDVTCGSRQIIKPVMKYSVPVEDKWGKTLDWWSSRDGLFYTDVRFANEWQVFHYHMPKAPVGPCSVNNVLPTRQGWLPWWQPETQVVKVKTVDGREFPFGSFIGIQRAGGTYALAKGSWKRARDPVRDEDQTGGQHENVRWDWTIDTGRSGPPWISLFNEGDGEWKLKTQTSYIHNRNRIYLYSEKKIYFPDGGPVTLNMVQQFDCAKVCRGNDGSDRVVMQYDVWNNDTEKKKGHMKAIASIFFSPTVSDPNTLVNAVFGSKESGIYVDGSYGPEGEEKTFFVGGDQSATFKPDPNTGYHLQYVIDFDMRTEGRFTNKTHWMYRAKLTPSWLYLTK
ncbi:MAG TPA: hypothetical protein VGD79_08685 [Thermoanaerobaculia bacterium]